MGDFTNDVDETDMTYVGKEMLNGVSCHVVESTKLEEGYHVKMWLHEEYGFPMKMESYNKDGSEAFVMEVTDFKVGDLSDALFEVPEDYDYGHGKSHSHCPISDKTVYRQNMTIFTGSGKTAGFFVRISRKVI